MRYTCIVLLVLLPVVQGARPENSQSSELEGGSPEAEKAAKHAGFLLAGMKNGWQVKVCQEVRLRKKELEKKKFVFELTRNQPNAAKDCFRDCENKAGWCAFCGGDDRGACCKKGEKSEKPGFDDPVCKEFDIPHGGNWLVGNHLCVQKDCQQENTEYAHDKKIKDGEKKEKVDSWQTCQENCAKEEKCEFFTWLKDGRCRLSGSGAKRTFSEGAISGPKTCEKPNGEETDPCMIKEAMTMEEFKDKNFGDGLHKCYEQVLKQPLKDYNTVYHDFMKHAVELAEKAGCELEDYKDYEDKQEDQEHLAEHGEILFKDCGWGSDSQYDLKLMQDLPAVALPLWMRRGANLWQCLEKVSQGSTKVDPKELTIEKMAKKKHI